MWASQWEITIDRPRKTSSFAGRYFPSFETRRIIVRSDLLASQLFGGKITESYCANVITLCGISVSFLWDRRLGLASFFTRSDNNLSSRRIVDVAAIRRRLAFFFLFTSTLLQLENVNSTSGYRTMTGHKIVTVIINFLLRNSETRVDKNLNAVA